MSELKLRGDPFPSALLVKKIVAGAAAATH
jgi:hypothetical protein